ncbi:hypothetical protein TNCV_4202731 [Trichonephila clavipes]|uniref:Tc1-like transposase DDE domain-containing protein n=1 Tax=Trichonephila clavipes TaxID=2585209 RepID=A0A8X6SCY4_TRICX|nr:hypothetical protein TNCV_4202731 [Trichonephila clavipes]
MLHSQLYVNISGKPHFSSSRITTPSRLAQTRFDEMGVQKLDWPSQNPDLNPIEHLWDELQHRLRRQLNRPSLLQALTSAVMDAWKAIPMVTYQKLVKKVFPNVDWENCPLCAWLKDIWDCGAHYVSCARRPPIDVSVWSGAAHEEVGLQRNGIRSSLVMNPDSILALMTIVLMCGSPLPLLYSDTLLPQLV